MDDKAGMIDAQPSAPALVKECEPIFAFVLGDSTLAQARYFVIAHKLLNLRWVNIEEFAQERRIDTKYAVGELYLHATPGFRPSS